MKMILVAVDGSSRADGVLAYAQSIAQRTGAKLILFRSFGIAPDMSLAWPVDFRSKHPFDPVVPHFEIRHAVARRAWCLHLTSGIGLGAGRASSGLPFGLRSRHTPFPVRQVERGEQSFAPPLPGERRRIDPVQGECACSHARPADVVTPAASRPGKITSVRVSRKIRTSSAQGSSPYS